MDQQVADQQCVERISHHFAPERQLGADGSCSIWTHVHWQLTEPHKCDEPGQRPQVDSLLGIEHAASGRAGDDRSVLFKFRYDVYEYICHCNASGEGFPPPFYLYCELATIVRQDKGAYEQSDTCKGNRLGHGLHAIRQREPAQYFFGTNLLPFIVA